MTTMNCFDRMTWSLPADEMNGAFARAIVLCPYFNTSGIRTLVHDRRPSEPQKPNAIEQSER